MNIIINGSPTEIPADVSTVTELIEHLGLGDRRVAVERNKEIVKKAEHNDTKLCEADELEILHFVGGG
ncbi:MAG: sulfur carrier protein ThiS [Candidatus Lindowbacteria bacterium]|nr:sulfur carrier protein ThiS [Candidatus Lindowbacteria bacterium]